MAVPSADSSFYENLRAHVQSQLERENSLQYDALQSEMDRRFAAVMREIELRGDLMQAELDRRFSGIIRETDLQFSAAKEAVAAALQAARDAVSAALAAADTAVGKAEAATEKRLENVNEFRAQQADLIARFASRNEIEAQLKAVSDKADTTDQRTREDIGSLQLQVQALNSLLLGREKAEEQQLGTSTFRQTEDYNATYRSRSQISLAIAAISGLIAVVSVIVVIMHP